MPPLFLANITTSHDPVPVLGPRDYTNTTGDSLHVICAWPVSSQYGPGSRILFYLLIAACVLARKANWIKDACLAAALLLPTVAAVHGIALAVLHQENAVDMDIYGAFQFCSIGILVAPITVRLSKTYIRQPGRNAIFVWTGLILAGLLSLTVEFYRTHDITCTHDDNGNSLSSDPSKFPYKENPKCGLTCSEQEGPFSRMRGGSASNIYVIPAPEILTFGTVTLLSAACCIQAILWLLSMTEKILEINWKSRSRSNDQERGDETIPGTNGATKEGMKKVNDNVKPFLNMAVVPVFGAAGIAIVIVGEVNFFSPQVSHQNEPMAAIGQWGSIVGVGLAFMGSLYLLVAQEVKEIKGKEKVETDLDHSGILDTTRDPSGTPRAEAADTGNASSNRPNTTDTVHCEGITENAPSEENTKSTGNAGREKFAKMVLAFSEKLGTAAHERFDDSDFHRGPVLNYPEVPGESFRSNNLRDIKRIYDPPQDEEGYATPLPRSSSRDVSFGAESGNCGRVNRSRRRQSSRSRQRASTLPTEGSSYQPQSSLYLTVTAGQERPRGRTLLRESLLQIPSRSRNRSNRERCDTPPPASSGIFMSGARSSNTETDEGNTTQNPPAISVSAESCMPVPSGCDSET